MIQHKEIAYRDNTVAMEDLPWPIALYPGHYGAFFGFRESDFSPIALCSCAREPIENYLRFRLSKPFHLNAKPARMYVLDSMYFPLKLCEDLMNQGIPSNEQVVDRLKFENKLCHECNRIVPKYRHCHENYGGTFKQNFGWYINKQAYEFGIEPISTHIIQGVCPQEILDQIKLDPEKTIRQVNILKELNIIEANELRVELEKQKRRVWKISNTSAI